MKEQSKNYTFKTRVTVFLDRDGVINEKAPEGDYIKSPEELKIINGALEAIRYFNEKGFLVIVVTNQRGIGKGVMSEQDFKNVMDKLKKLLALKSAYIDAYYYCPDGEETSPCRKPNIGMFLQAKKDFPEIDFKNSFVVGDSWRDIEAGKRIGAKTVLVKTNKHYRISPDLVINRLEDFVEVFKI